MIIYRDFSFTQNMLSMVILIAAYFLLFIIGVKRKKDILIVSLIYFWHSIFSFTYFILTSRPGALADSLKYFRISKGDLDYPFYPGSPFVYLFSRTFSKGLDFSYLNTTLIYNFIGSLGIVLFYLSIKKYFNTISKYWLMFLFVPSMSYWSSGLGKDAFSFLSVCLLIYATTSNSKFKLLILALSFFIMFMVRPHVAFAMLVSFVVYFIIQSKAHILFKASTLPIISIFAVVSLNFVQEYAGLDEASLDGIGDYYESRSGFNMQGGSSIDTSSMILPVKMFSYIFRPFPFEAHSLIAFIASIENSLLLITITYIVYKAKGSFTVIIKNENLWLLLYVIITWIMLSYGLKNLGIAARQKWMFMPVIIYLLLTMHSNSKIRRLH
ncbi:hypothetical protein [Psychrobacter sp. M13]|uniref:hypothetical protein n=1 Tax=Psychrobacter sp. M13 TaxID=3067275 RepID=UPI00273A8F15|nr:hypothetical protein [Psychrobacter sp. M13]WLP95227.1 hypothetical protein Q9G97_03725 [Psychrobacter sp. M13]